MPRFPFQLAPPGLQKARRSPAWPAQQLRVEGPSRARWRSLSFLVVVVVLVSLCRPYKHHPAIYSDGVGHHLWTRALLEGDLSFRRYAQHEELAGGPPRQRIPLLRLADPARRIYQNKYPPGVALLRFPVMAFLVDRTSDHPLISRAEHWASTVLAALSLLGTCLLCLQACRLLRLGSAASHVAVLTMVFGTGLFHYGTYDGCFSHIYSALVGALLLWLGVRAVVGGRATLPPLATALACFFLVLIRNTNLLLLGGLVVAYLGARHASGTWSWRHIGQDLAVLLAGTGTGSALQLGYNWYANGGWAVSSYQGEAFLWQRPMQLAVLFSYQRGIFLYYPILAVVLGAGLAVRRTRWWTALFALVLLAYVILYGFWWCWPVGSRGIVEALPPGIVLLATALEALSRRGRRIVTVCACLCVLVTLELMVGDWSWRLCGADNARELYWQHVTGNRSILWFLSRRPF